MLQNTHLRRRHPDVLPYRREIQQLFRQSSIHVKNDQFVFRVRHFFLPKLRPGRESLIFPAPNHLTAQFRPYSIPSWPVFCTLKHMNSMAKAKWTPLTGLKDYSRVLARKIAFIAIGWIAVY